MGTALRRYTGNLLPLQQLGQLQQQQAAAAAAADELNLNERLCISNRNQQHGQAGMNDGAAASYSAWYGKNSVKSQFKTSGKR